jgi:hypothetical protein
MITIIRGLAAGVILAGAAVGLASPASAEPLDGSYAATMLDGGGIKKNGSTTTFTLTSSCGPDCISLHTGSGSPFDLHRQGNAWTGSVEACTWRLDNSSLVITRTCPDQPNIVIGLTKNG